MKPSAKGIVGANPNIVLLGIVIWGIVAAYLALHPVPKIILPFIGISGLLLLFIPFKIIFPLFIVYSLILMPGDISIVIKGWRLNILEVFLNEMKYPASLSP